MMGAISECFNSPFCKETKGFFDHVKSLFDNYEKRDKFAKCVDPILEAIGEMAKANNASEETLGKLSAGRAWAQGARDFFGLVNSFTAIPTFWNNCNSFCGMLLSLNKTSEKPIPLDLGVEIPAHPGNANEYNVEKGLAAAAYAGKAISSGTAITGFAVRTITSFDKHIRDKEGRRLLEIDEGVLKVGRTFPTIMFVNHLGSLVGSGCELGLQLVAYHRGIVERNDLMGRVQKISLSIVEKTLELPQDFAYHLGRPLPTWVRLVLTLVICAIGLYTSWRDTTPK